MTGFQQAVNILLPLAVAGDFASSNPRANVLASSTGAGLVAGPNGVRAGTFAWVDSSGVIVTNSGTGVPTGFVHRNQQSVITVFLDESTMMVRPGFNMALMDAGDFYVVNNGAGAATVGQKAFANNTTGLVAFAAANATIAGGTCATATLAKIVSATTGGALPTTNNVTGSIAGTTLTVTAVGASVVGVGAVLTGTGIEPYTTVLAQVSGTGGGIGVYTVSVSQTVTSTTIAVSGGGLTLTGGNTSGVFAVGMTISGTNIPTGTTILGYGTATAGGAGTYYVSNPAVTAATASTITAANAMFLTLASSTGTYGLNDTLSGSGVVNQTIAANHTTNANLTGTGGDGTYLTSAYQASALTSQEIDVLSATETKWTAKSAGAVGELIKITSWA